MRIVVPRVEGKGGRERPRCRERGSRLNRNLKGRKDF